MILRYFFVYEYIFPLNFLLLHWSAATHMYFHNHVHSYELFNENYRYCYRVCGDTYFRDVAYENGLNVLYAHVKLPIVAHIDDYYIVNTNDESRIVLKKYFIGTIYLADFFYFLILYRYFHFSIITVPF